MAKELLVDTVFWQDHSTASRASFERLAELCLVLTELDDGWCVFGDALQQLFMSGLCDPRVISNQARAHGVDLEPGIISKAVAALSRNALEDRLTSLPANPSDINIDPSELISRLHVSGQAPTLFGAGGILHSGLTAHFAWVTHRVSTNSTQAAIECSVSKATGNIDLLEFPRQYAHRIDPGILFSATTTAALNAHLDSIRIAVAGDFVLTATLSFIDNISQSGNEAFLADSTCLVSLLTLAERLAREGFSPIHDCRPIRVSEAPDSAQQTRADGAKAFRATLRSSGVGWRVHYWKHGSARTIELVNLVKKSDPVKIA